MNTQFLPVIFIEQHKPKSYQIKRSLKLFFAELKKNIMYMYIEISTEITPTF